MMLVSRQCRYSITRSAVRGSTLSLGSRHISTEVYIKGLGDVTEEQLSRLMSPYGVLAKCSISKQPAPRGTLCTLTFADISGAIAAVDALDDTIMRRKSANWHESVMGSTSSHLNCYALSQIICLSPTDLFHILAFYSQKYPSRADTRITRDELRALLLECETHPSDIDIMCNILTCSDIFGRGYGLMKKILTALLLLMPLEFSDKIKVAIDILYGSETVFISKKDLGDLVKTLNAALGYYGDKNIYPSQVDDLVDSVFTMCGKVDGEISRYDAILAVSRHPIVEMVTSLQFQGSIIQKKEFLAAELGEQL